MDPLGRASSYSAGLFSAATCCKGIDLHSRRRVTDTPDRRESEDSHPVSCGTIVSDRLHGRVIARGELPQSR